MAKKRRSKKAGMEIGASPVEDKKWMARNDLDTISRAQEVIGDSARLKAAKAEAKRQQESIARINRLKGRQI